MQISDLEYFVTLAEKLSYTKAARALFISQSSLSKSIVRLEDALGVTLFERDSHGVILTPAGDSFYKDIITILDDYRHAVDKAHKFEKNKLDILHVGGHLANPKIYALVEAARSRPSLADSGISITVDSAHVGSIERRPGLLDPYEDARDGTNDVSLLYTSDRAKTESDLCFTPLYRDSLIAFVPLDSPLSGRSSVSFRDFSDSAIVTTTTYYTFSWAVRELFEKKGIVPAYRLRVADSMTDLLQRRAQDEAYIMCRSMAAIAPSEKASGLRMLPFEDGSSILISAAFLPAKKSVVIDRFIETLRSLVREDDTVIPIDGTRSDAGDR